MMLGDPSEHGHDALPRKTCGRHRMPGAGFKERGAETGPKRSNLGPPPSAPRTPPP
jgi:hypothetical protein